MGDADAGLRRHPQVESAFELRRVAATLKLVPRFWKASAAVGVVLPKTYWQAIEARPQPDGVGERSKAAPQGRLASISML